MPQFLPPNLLALFAARDPIPYLPPVDKLSWEKKTDGYAGIGHLIHRFEHPKDTPAPIVVETRDEKMTRKKREKAEQMQYKLEQEIALWDPHSNEVSITDSYKTLFVARLNYDSSESKLRREFEGYGPIKQIVLVHHNKTSKPRGYAFIEYEHERDMHSAYKHADGKKIDNRRILVDVERSRTVTGWLPRRLGGGLGGTRIGGEDVNVKISGRENDRKRTDERISREQDKERERERGRDRDYDRNRDRGGDRSRRRDDRGDRRRRSRSRDRKRKRSQSRDRAEVDDKHARRRHRSRERNGHEDEDRKNHRIVEKNGQDDEDRKRRDHRRRSRDRSRERKHRRDKDRARDPDAIKIKQEPQDDYPDYAEPPLLAGANISMKPEEK